MNLIDYPPAQPNNDPEMRKLYERVRTMVRSHRGKVAIITAKAPELLEEGDTFFSEGLSGTPWPRNAKGGLDTEIVINPMAPKDPDRIRISHDGKHRSKPDAKHYDMQLVYDATKLKE